MSMEEEILNKLTRQYFCENLGFEEGMFYFNMIINNEEFSKKNYSRSKKYRLLKKLYEEGAIAKIGNDSENIKFLPLPPPFLSKNTIDKEVIGHIEKIYLAHQYNKLLEDLNKKACLHISIRGHKNNSLILFLLKYYMKKSAIILMGGTDEFEFYKRNLNKESIEKIKYYLREDYDLKTSPGARKIKSCKIGNKRLAIIDGEIIVEFLKTPNDDYFNHPERTLFTGYIIGPNFETTTNKGKENYAKLIEKEIKELIQL